VKLLQDVFASRKCQATLVAVLLAVWGTSVGLSEDQAKTAINAVLVYILGRGVHDAGIAIKSP